MCSCMAVGLGIGRGCKRKQMLQPVDPKQPNILLCSEFASGKTAKDILDLDIRDTKYVSRI